MALAKVTTSVTYKVPAWGHCNLQANMFGKPSKDKCRFCAKEKGYYRCALYNEVLATSGDLIKKARACEKATAGFASVVEDEVPQVDPKLIIKSALTEYVRVRKQLIAQGYPEAVADKVAADYLIGGNK